MNIAVLFLVLSLGLLFCPFTSSGTYKGRVFVINISYIRVYSSFEFLPGAFLREDQGPDDISTKVLGQRCDIRGKKKKKRERCRRLPASNQLDAQAALCPSDNPSLK